MHYQRLAFVLSTSWHVQCMNYLQVVGSSVQQQVIFVPESANAKCLKEHTAIAVEVARDEVPRPPACGDICHSYM